MYYFVLIQVYWQGEKIIKKIQTATGQIGQAQSDRLSQADTLAIDEEDEEPLYEPVEVNPAHREKQKIVDMIILLSNI